MDVMNLIDKLSSISYSCAEIEIDDDLRWNKRSCDGLDELLLVAEG